MQTLWPLPLTTPIENGRRAGVRLFLVFQQWRLIKKKEKERQKKTHFAQQLLLSGFGC